VPGRRGRRACRRRTDRGHDAAAGRSRCGRLDRRPHRAFFSAALEGENDGQRVTEDAPDRGLGNEAGEAVDVQEALAFWHPRIGTSFPRRGKAKFAGKTRRKSASVIKSYPHDFTKSRFCFTRQDFVKATSGRKVCPSLGERGFPRRNTPGIMKLTWRECKGLPHAVSSFTILMRKRAFRKGIIKPHILQLRGQLISCLRISGAS
jgi:hypothetical protein